MLRCSLINADPRRPHHSRIRGNRTIRQLAYLTNLTFLCLHGSIQYRFSGAWPSVSTLAGLHPKPCLIGILLQCSCHIPAFLPNNAAQKSPEVSIENRFINDFCRQESLHFIDKILVDYRVLFEQQLTFRQYVEKFVGTHISILDLFRYQMNRKSNSLPAEPGYVP